MDELYQAINKARLFIEPTTSFTWGSKIYEPEDDGSPQAALKKEVIVFGKRVISHFESGRRYASILPFPSGTEDYMSKIDEVLASDHEQRDYQKFVQAIQDVIDIGSGQA